MTDKLFFTKSYHCLHCIIGFYYRGFKVKQYEFCDCPKSLKQVYYLVFQFQPINSNKNTKFA